MSQQRARQPDPQPQTPVVEAPSLIAYGAVLVASIALCWWALELTSNRKELWASLLINIGSGLAGAVLVFVALERRLRTAELKRLGAVVPLSYEFLFHKHLRAKIQYAQLLLIELERIEPTDLSDSIDLAPTLEAYPDGFCATGSVGVGKTVAIQQLGITLAKTFLLSPRTAALPILVPMSKHRKSSLENNLWYEGMMKFGVRLAVARDLNRKGRRIVLLDGIDESPKGAAVVEEITKLIKDSPRTVVVATCRHPLDGLTALPVVDVSREPGTQSSIA